MLKKEGKEEQTIKNGYLFCLNNQSNASEAFENQ